MHAFNDNTIFIDIHTPPHYQPPAFLKLSIGQQSTRWGMDRGKKIESLKAEQVYLVHPKEEPLKDKKIT